MFSCSDLALPIFGAPMAGGPTTPALVVAVSEAGGLGTLAGGYLSADEFAQRIAEVQALTNAPFGVNVFVPEAVESAPAAVTSYREALAPLANTLKTSLPAVTAASDDDYHAKLDVIVDAKPALVSFAFGNPQAEVLQRMHRNGIATAVTVTSPEEALEALANEPTLLIVQGTSAGGHRSVHDQSAEPNDLDAIDLLPQIRELAAATDTELIAAGGIDSPAAARRLLEAGAAAVQIGTLLLTATEAGTKPAHRAALLAASRDTVVTRAFSGRAARALRNTFIDRMDAHAPAAYPQVNALVAPIKAAAADDPELQNLWAGTGYRACRARTTAAILAPFITELTAAPDTEQDDR